MKFFEEVDVVRGSINLLPADKILWYNFMKKFLSFGRLSRTQTHMLVLVQPK